MLNRQFLKGSVIAVIFLGMLSVLVYFLFTGYLGFLRAGGRLPRPDEIQEILFPHQRFFLVIKVLLPLLWIYAVIDAFWVGRRLDQKKQN